MQESNFRNKIIWFNFILCIPIIWIHSYNVDLFSVSFPGQNFARAELIEFYVSNIIARSAVPGFIMLSGYLFFRNFSMDQLIRKWKSRVKSILLPYLLWNALYYLGYAVAGMMPMISEVVNRGTVDVSPVGFFKAVLFFEFNPVFWFMYQLLLLIFLAPAFYVILKKVWSAILLFGLLLFGISREFYLPHLNLDAAFYYSIAAFCAIHMPKLTEKKWSIRREILGIGLIAAAAILNYRIFHVQNVMILVLYHAVVTVGVWLSLNEAILFEAKPVMKTTFFVYALHFIIVRFINKGTALVFSGNETAALFVYFLMPIPAIVVCFQVSKLLEKYVPAVWRILNGGR